MRTVTLLALLLCSPLAAATELILKPVPVAPDVYAVVGDLGGQTYENEGLNNNLGFVVTDAGVLVINTGPTLRVAQALHTAIKKTTGKPVKWVVNGNSQNHYWHGNAYFHALGAVIYASQGSDGVMREMGGQQLEANKNLLKEKAHGTSLSYPTELIDGRRELTFGKTRVELHPLGPAHTPGDTAVWLPSSRVVFTGDLVYTERMLAIIPIGNTNNWVQSFDKLAALKPAVVVPGHGHPTDMARATRDTRDYLVYLRTEVGKRLEKDEDINDVVAGVDQSRFQYLANFDLLARRNVHNLYMELDRERF
jgi:glyoxylase-like metal-dependent hydrolase (beta-lactamase superfamily II)